MLAHAIDRNAAVYVAGHRGLVGSGLVRRLEAEGFTRVLYATRQEVDLRDQTAVPRKLPDVSRLHGLAWRHRIALPAGLASTYQWFRERSALGAAAPQPAAARG